MSTLINKELGIQYCGGNEELYYSLLKRFVSQYSNHIEELKEADWEKRRMLVHSVKGITLNLGAKELYEQSLIQEKKIIIENTLIDEYINVYNNTLKSIKDII